MFDWINIGIGSIMKFCYNITNNYALALFLFAIFAQIILFFFSIKTQKNAQKQSLLKPKEYAINKKYGDTKDPEILRKKQEELSKMHQENGYNPASGCLPMILMMLIIFPLYGVIRNPLTYISDVKTTSVNQLYAIVAKANEQDAKIADVDFEALKLQLNEKGEANDVPSVNSESPSETSAPAKKSFKDIYKSVQQKGQIELVSVLRSEDNTFTDEQLTAVGIDTTNFNRKQLNFDFLGLSLLETPSFNNIALLSIPLLVFLTSVLSQMITTKWTSSGQIGPDGKEVAMPGGALMKWGMPAMSAVFAMSFNAAIGLYWIYGNIIRIGQSWILSKMFPLKKWTVEELQEAEKEYRKKAKKKKVIMIEVDEDDNSFSKYEISKPQAEKKLMKSNDFEAEALKQAKELDKELDAKAEEIAKNAKYKDPSEGSTKNNGNGKTKK